MDEVKTDAHSVVFEKSLNEMWLVVFGFMLEHVLTQVKNFWVKECS